jgi:hypothetical protein
VPRGQYGGQLTPNALRLLAPPRHQPAWERATAEQRAAAIEREQRRERREAELLEQVRAVTIDQETYAALGLALDAELHDAALAAPHDLGRR